MHALWGSEYNLYQNYQQSAIAGSTMLQQPLSAYRSGIFFRCYDRFLIIDQTELYHIGASLKDIGKKWFAFSRMDISQENAPNPM
jgi:hypothetical protein